MQIANCFGKVQDAMSYFEKLKDAGKLLVVLDRKMTGTTDELIRD